MSNETKEKKTDWSSIDTSIKYEGKQISLPGDPSEMSYDDAIQTLQRIKKAEAQKYDVHELIAGAPWDAAVAVYKALQSIYGVVLAESRETWFGEIKPQFLTVNTGVDPDDKVQVPHGQMRLPNVADPIQMVLHHNGVIIAGSVRKSDRSILIDIANRAREILAKDSVYRGKAVHFRVDENGHINIEEQPDFIDLRKVGEADVIHVPETEALIRNTIFAPLKHTASCRKHGVPLKRGVLLSGKYGCGKSLTARVTAKVATDNGWTFIMLNRSQGLAAAIEFAKPYQPCVIFAEDIDRVTKDRENDESVNDLVNLLDGLITKDMEILTVLTTNFVDKIDKALLRPGRFDAVIDIKAPDAPTAVRLIKAYARDLLAPGNLDHVGEIISGWIPATVREVVERSKMTMLIEDRKKITADDLYTAAIGMQQHMQLLEGPVASQSPAERFAESLGEVIIGQLSKGSDGLATADLVAGVYTNLVNQNQRTQNRIDNVSMKVDGAAGSASTAASEARDAKAYAEAGFRATEKVAATVKEIAASR